jgi:nucleoid-associated protein YgaU
MPPGSRQHTVVPGDTLASIAMKYYRNRAMSNNIKDANFNQLGGKDTIKPGQVLIIPEAPKRRN